VQLTIVAESSTAPAPPDVADPAATVWRDGTGAVVALGQTMGDDHWIHVSGRGAFRFPPSGGGVSVVPDTAVDPELVEDTFRRIILPLALQAQGREVLHASAVQGPHGVIALCAVAGTGKSTLACGLSRRGHRLWADDAVCFEPNADIVAAMPLPFTLRLRPESAAFFADEPRPHVPQTPDAVERLARVCVLERSEGMEPAIERLGAAEAFREVLTHAYCFSMRDRPRNEAMVQNYLELVDRLPVYRVTFPEGLSRLDAILDLIEAAE